MPPTSTVPSDQTADSSEQIPLRLVNAKLTSLIPRTIMNLRGPAVFWLSESSSSSAPKLHIDVACDGLRYVRAQKPGRSTMRRAKFSGHRDLELLGADPVTRDIRPCRMCALEPVLSSVLNPTEPGPRRWVTFTSQPAYRADEARFRSGDVSESGRERLKRIAAAAGLETTWTGCGPVAYGTVPASGVPLLERNLRTVVRDEGVDNAEFVSVLWSLLSDDPPELAFGLDPDSDPWLLAEAICA